MDQFRSKRIRKTQQNCDSLRLMTLLISIITLFSACALLAQTSPSGQGEFCGQCGYRNTAGAKVCEKCGAVMPEPMRKQDKSESAPQEKGEIADSARERTTLQIIEHPAAVFCGKCGTKNLAGTVFCSSCGARLPEAGAKSAEEKTIFCGYCGTENRATDPFCGKCGRRLLVGELSGAFDYANETNISHTLTLNSNLRLENVGDRTSFMGDGQLEEKYSIEKASSGFRTELLGRYNSSSATGSETVGGLDLTALTENKFYLSNSKFFGYVGTEAKYVTTINGSSSFGQTAFSTPLIVLAGGMGQGRLIDIANYKRAKNIEKLLLDQNLIPGLFSKNIMMEIISILGGIGSSESKMKKVIETLQRSNQLMVSSFNLEAYLELQRIVSDNIKTFLTGFEFKCGFRQEVLKPYQGYDLSGMIILGLRLSQQVGPRSVWALEDEFYTPTSSLLTSLANATTVSLRNYFSTKADLKTSYTLTLVTGGGTETTHLIESVLNVMVQNNVSLNARAAIDSEGGGGQAQVFEDLGGLGTSSAKLVGWQSAAASSTDKKWSLSISAALTYYVF